MTMRMNESDGRASESVELLVAAHSRVTTNRESVSHTPVVSHDRLCRRPGTGNTLAGENRCHNSSHKIQVSLKRTMAKNSRSATATPPSVDEALSQLASSSLSIVTSREIVKFETRYALPSKSHAGLYGYSSSLLDTDATMNDSKSNSSSAKDTGVPGFPDFPDCWGGEEGGVVVWMRNPPSASAKGNEKRAQSKNRRIVRQAVNAAGISISRAKSNDKADKKAAKAVRKAKKVSKRRKTLQKRHQKQQMKELSHGLSSLSCG
jgi:hypothetical protein